MKLSLAVTAAFLCLAGLSSAQELGNFDLVYTATDAATGADYTIDATLTGYLSQVNVEDQYIITAASGTWAGTPDGTLGVGLNRYDGTSSIEFPPSGSGLPATIPPVLYMAGSISWAPVERTMSPLARARSTRRVPT